MNIQYAQHITRRHFFHNCQVGIGGIALASLLGSDGVAAPEMVNPLQPRQPHFPARAKNVIFLHMAGSPPHLDLFDYKPELVKHNDEDCPAEYLQGKRLAVTK